jgi:NAD(P)H-dependent FMN reductase
MAEVAIVSSSPGVRSRLDTVTETLQRQLIESAHRVRRLNLCELPHSALMVGNDDHPKIQWSQRMLKHTQGVALVMPAYEISGGALVNAWMRLLPSSILSGKTLQLIGLGAFRSHAARIDYAFARRVGDSTRVLPSCFLFDKWFGHSDNGWLLDPVASDRLSQATAEFTAELDQTVAMQAS